MIKIELAGSVIEIDNRFRYTADKCAGYETKAPADISVSLSPQQIIEECTSNPQLDLGYCEHLAVYRKICRQLASHGTFLFHGALFEYEGEGVLLAAPSGTGKTTHMNLWMEHAPAPVTVINGDKPLIKREPKIGWVGYGTPWAGKEELETNASVPLSAILVLEQGTTDEMSELPGPDAFAPLMNQLFFPNSGDTNALVLEALASLLKEVPVHRLRCTPTKASVDVALGIFHPDQPRLERRATPAHPSSRPRPHQEPSSPPTTRERVHTETEKT